MANKQLGAFKDIICGLIPIFKVDGGKIALDPKKIGSTLGTIAIVAGATCGAEVLIDKIDGGIEHE